MYLFGFPIEMAILHMLLNYGQPFLDVCRGVVDAQSMVLSPYSYLHLELSFLVNVLFPSPDEVCCLL